MLLELLVAFFLDNRTECGLVLDRRSNTQVVSVAATGFGFLARAHSARLGRGVVLARDIRSALDAIERHNPPENRGWVSHFVGRDGRPLEWSEVSTVDTAILYEGALRAAIELGDVALIEDVFRRKARIDVDFMMVDGYLRHGFYNVRGEVRPLDCVWDSNSEGVIVYRAFGLAFTPRYVDYGLPLFCYAYPLCFWDDESLRDALRRAVECQRVRYGRVGITACDGPDGYQVGRTDVISPLLLEAIRPLVPAVEDTLRLLPVPRDTQAYAPGSGWRSSDRIGIDDGSAAILIRLYGGR